MLLLTLGLIAIVVLQYRLLGWIKCVSEDLYDIKKYLKLPVVLRTKERRHIQVTEFIDQLVKAGRTKEEILRGLEVMSVLPDFANPSFLGKLKASSYRKYIDDSMGHFKTYGKTVTETIKGTEEQ